MNRMAALIHRSETRPGTALIERRAAAERDAFDDLRLFATGWIAGLIFFGTLLS